MICVIQFSFVIITIILFVVGRFKEEEEEKKRKMRNDIGKSFVKFQIMEFDRLVIMLCLL